MVELYLFQQNTKQKPEHNLPYSYLKKNCEQFCYHNILNPTVVLSCHYEITWSPRQTLHLDIITPWHNYAVTPLHRDIITPWQNYAVTPLHRDTIKPCQHYTVTPLHRINDTPCHQLHFYTIKPWQTVLL